METLNKFSRHWLIVALPLLALICYIVALKIVNSIDYHNNDFFTFYLAGHLVTLGGDPYSPEQWVLSHNEFDVTWIPNQTFVYPLPLSLFFAPFGLLSLYRAYILWVALSETMLLLSLSLLTLLNIAPGAKFFFIPLLVGTIFFRPTILTLYNGQISGWLLLILTGIVFLWEKGKWEWGSLLLPLLMLKPNIGAPFIFLLGIWLLLQKHYKSILTLLFGGVALMIIGIFQNPGWVIEYWNIGNTKLVQTFGGSPTVWGLSALIFHNDTAGTLVAGSLAALLCVLIFFIILLRPDTSKKPLFIIGLAVTITLLITPYTWTYDQLLLLIPITGITFALNEETHRFLYSSIFFLFIDFLAFLLLLPDSMLGIEVLNAFIPLLILVLCTWQIFSPTGSQKDRRKREQEVGT